MAKYKVHITGLNTNQLKVLTNSEMIKLFKLYENNSELAKELLIQGNLKLVLSLVQRFANRCDNMDDLFQVGCIGLLKAIENFDLKHEVRFSTYAVPMILGEIKRYLRDNQMIRISRSLKDLSYKIYFEKEAYIQQYKSEPSIAYLAHKLEVKEKDIVDAMDSCSSVVSIYEVVYQNDGDELYLIDQIKDENDKSGKINDYLTLYDGLSQLNKKEQNIIRKRYFDDLTQSEIACELGISQAQVSRLEKNALKNLKQHFSNE